MSETLTMNEAPADQPQLNADEQESLAIAEANEAAQTKMLAGKFKDAESLEQAYLELQRKLGEPKDNVRDEEGDEETEAPEEVEESTNEQPKEEYLTEAQAEEIFQSIGGKKAYQSMIQWAQQNLSENEVQMYDAVMGKGDPNAIFFAVQALYNRYSENVGSEGQLLTGKGNAEKGVAFRSQAELVQAMNDPRYESDPAYRQDVMRKLANSDIQF